MKRADVAGKVLAAMVKAARPGESVAVEVEGDDIELSVILPPDEEDGRPAWRAETTTSQLAVAIIREGGARGVAEFALAEARREAPW